jgi:hypothetical protein
MPHAGAYGDCWAFGVSGVLEGVNVVQGKNKVKISLQLGLPLSYSCLTFITHFTH